VSIQAGTGTTAGGSAVLSSAKGDATVTVTGMSCRLMPVERIIEFLNFSLHPDYTTINFRLDDNNVCVWYCRHHPAHSARGYGGRQ